MEILKCLAVDDEPHALELLEAFIQKVPFLTLHAKTTAPWDALKILKEESIDLLFLDIQMDELSGIQFLDINTSKVEVIITSAYTEYALDGYAYQVSDYLLKPYSFDRFLKAVSSVQEKLTKKTTPKVEDTVPKNTNFFIKGDAKNKFHQVRLQDILYIEGLKNYVQFNCKNEKITTLQNMKTLENELPSTTFFRIHRSFIINIDHVSKIDGNVVYLKEERIPIGQSYRAEFLEMIRGKA